MNLRTPNREPFFCYLTKDAKDGLNQLAKYHKTTLTSLMEEGAHMVIRSHLKQIHAREYQSQQVNNIAVDTW